jgi:hypothetical protein
MGPELTDNRRVELSADASHVVGAWLLAVVVVTFLMTVIAPFLNA